MIKDYVGERVVTNGYAANMYLRLGPQAAIYVHLSKDDVMRRQQRMEVQFLQPGKASKAKKATTGGKKEQSSGATKGRKGAADASPSSTVPRKRTTEDRKGKGKARDYGDVDDSGGSESAENFDVDAILEAEGYKSSDEEDYLGNDDVDREIEGGIFGSKAHASQQSSRHRPTQSTLPPMRRATLQTSRSSVATGASRTSSSLKSKVPEVIDISDSESERDEEDEGAAEDGWTTNLRGAPPRKKARNSLESEEVISVLSD
jgi:hypothetical protein